MTIYQHILPRQFLQPIITKARNLISEWRAPGTARA